MTTTKKVRVEVMQQPQNEVPTEVLATSIKEISEGMKRLRSGRLNDRALLTLLQRSCGVSQSDIKSVMDGLESLSRDYLK